MQALNRLAPLALILALSVPATAQEAIRWQTNLDQAKKIAAETNRLVLVHFWAEWCGPCKRLERSVFTQPGVGAALEASYVPVKLNLDRNRLLAQKYNVRSIPTDVVISPTGQVVASFVSPQNPQGYIAQVSQIAQRSLQGAGTQVARAGAALAPQGSSPYAGIGQPYQTPNNGAPNNGAPGYAAPQYQTAAVQNPAPTGPPAGDRYGQSPYGQQPAQTAQNPYAAAPTPPAGYYDHASSGPTAQQPTSQGYRPGTPQSSPYAPQGQTSTPAYGAIPNQAGQDRYNQDRYTAPQNNTQPPVVATAPPQQSRNSYGSDDRYGSAPTQPVSPPQATYPQQPAPRQTMNPYGNQGVPPMPQQVQQAPVQQAPVQQPAVQQNPYVPQQPQQPPQPQKMAATKPSPYAIDGYCPVELMNAQRWTVGDKQFGAVHRGQTFLFASAENQKQFLANPDRFAPALGGIDPILALENQQSVSGKRNHGVYFRDRIYLFSNEATLNRFNQNPGHYAEGVRQALLRQNGANQLR